MSRDPVTGIYTVPAGTAGISGQVIASPAYNNFLADISQAISQSIATTGQTPMAAALNMGGFRINNVAAPTATTDAANKLYVDSQSQFGGFQNKIRNGAFDVWQRGPGPLTVPLGSSAYNADGWICAATGAATSVSQIAGRLLTRYALSIAGAAGVTQVSLIQRIESFVAAPLTNQQVLFQAWIYNATAAAITPVFGAAYASATDNFASLVSDAGSVNLQSCAPGVWTRVAYAFPATLASNGYSLQLNFGALTSASVAIAEADFRVAPGVATGLVASPPPPELRPIGVEMPFCQRYFEVSYSTGVAIGAVTNAGCCQVYITGLTNGLNVGAGLVTFKARKRAAPSTGIWSTSGAANGMRDNLNASNVTPTVNALGDMSMLVYGNVSAAQTAVNMTFHWTANAEL
jgi:hypothetical protein